MGNSRRSRSRSDSRERSGGGGGKSSKDKSRKSDKDKDKKKSSSSSTSASAKGDPSASSSSSRRERDRDRDGDRDRDRDREHRDYKDRRGGGGSGRSRGGRDHDRDRDYRDRDRDRDYRDRDRDGSRDRKRSRGDRDRDDGGRRRGRDGGDGHDGDPEDLWKKKLRNEDEQLQELDVDSLMVDEEEEERRLEEQRRKRKEKLEALQSRKKAEEAATAAAAAAAATSDSRQSPPSSSNGNPSATTNGGGGGGGGYENDSDDDSDAGPIEITKQASKDGGQEGEGEGEGEGDAGDGAFDIEPPVPGEGGGGGGGKKTGVKHEGGGDGVANSKAEGGVSSSELRAQRGKEDRPVFDMFSAAALPAAGGPGGKMGGKGGNGGAHGMSFLGEDGGGDQGNWTDVEGYYKTRVGEVIGGRYTVLGSVGQGVFSTVLKCLDTRAGPGGGASTSEVALKMIRNNDTMRKAAQKEVALLKELAEHDPLNKKHCIRLLSSLEHKQHVVMVFESMQMNLRETLKKFGRKTGINIHAVQKYAKQLMAALKHMASRNLVHADIKPDNILVDQGFGSLKLADFGSAFRESDPDNDPTPYLVSRWYRAPEIVMGLDYDKAIDLWSVAVTLFELYKGSPVLPGVNNNEMLKRMMEFKGPVPARMVKSHMRAFETMGGIRPHFTEGGQFMQQEPDPVSGQTTVRLVTVMAPARPIKADIMRSKGAQDKKDTVADLADFLDKCMMLDPRQRMSLAQCSTHSFLRRA